MPTALAPPRGASPRPRDNGLLARLSPDDLARLTPRLQPADLPLRTVLQEPNSPIEAVHFLTSGVSSILSYADEDDPMEIGLAGREGMAGLDAALGLDAAAHKTFMQVEGASLSLDVEDLRQAMAEIPALAAVIHCYAGATLGQTGQFCACNGRHDLTERLARWLLMTRDRIDDDHLPITREFLSLMLGVRRAEVAVALGLLQTAGFIGRRRGTVIVLDRVGLERATCACYGRAKLIYERAFAGLPRGGRKYGGTPPAARLN